MWNCLSRRCCGEKRRGLTAVAAVAGVQQRFRTVKVDKKTVKLQIVSGVLFRGERRQNEGGSRKDILC